MSASANGAVGHDMEFEPAETCKVVVFCEDTQARAGAMHVCERLVDRFAEELDFEFGWWKFSRLAEPNIAQRASVAASAADIVIFCVRRTDLSREASEWLDAWMNSGVKRNGALTLVYAGQDTQAPPLDNILSRFEHTAQRMGMDFIHLSLPAPGTAAYADNPAANAAPPVPAPDPGRPHVLHWGLND